MELLGPLAIAFLLILFVIWPLTLGRRYVRGRRDRAFSQRARETWMGAPGLPSMGGYVPHGPQPPSPREQLKSPPDGDELP